MGGRLSVTCLRLHAIAPTWPQHSVYNTGFSGAKLVFNSTDPSSVDKIALMDSVAEVRSPSARGARNLQCATADPGPTAPCGGRVAAIHAPNLAPAAGVVTAGRLALEFTRRGLPSLPPSRLFPHPHMRSYGPWTARPPLRGRPFGARVAPTLGWSALARQRGACRQLRPVRFFSILFPADTLRAPCSSPPGF